METIKISVEVSVNLSENTQNFFKSLFGNAIAPSASAAPAAKSAPSAPAAPAKPAPAKRETGNGGGMKIPDFLKRG